MEYIRLVKEEITEGMFKSIKEAFEISVKVRDSVLEEATNLDFYVSLIILLSFDYAYGDLIDSGNFTDSKNNQVQYPANGVFR